METASLQPKTVSGSHIEGDDTSLSLPFTCKEWPRNGREVIRVRLDRYQGRETIDIRCWYPKIDGEMAPGRGFTISVKHLPDLFDGLGEALAVAVHHGLVPPVGMRGGEE